MSTTTAINGWTIPELADVPNIETAIHPLANAIDARVIPIFTTTGARDSAITSPSQGQHCEVTATGEHYRYNGSLWVSASPRVKYKPSNEQVTSSAVLQNDNDFFMTVEANALYIVDLWLMMTGSNAGDFRSLWTFPASTTLWRQRHVMTEAGTTDSDFKDHVVDGTATNEDSGVINTTATTPTIFHERVIVDTAGTSGTLQFQWCQATSSGTATTVFAGSTMECWKVG